MTSHTDPFAHAEQTAATWLTAVATELNTDDHHAYRILRAWLHTVRDRLTTDSAAHLAAQLPALLRGVYYEGWVPSRVPIRYDGTEFTHRFAREAGIPPADVPAAATAVCAVMDRLFSAGQLDHALAQLPHPLRAVLTGGAPARPKPVATPSGSRLARLEHAVEILTEAVTELAKGLEPNPLDEPNGERSRHAARTVHRLLLAE